MKLKGTDDTIPTFDEFLALVDGKVGILCEIKGLEPLRQLHLRGGVREAEDLQGQHRAAILQLRRGEILPPSHRTPQRSALHVAEPLRDGKVAPHGLHGQAVDQQALQAPLHRLRRERPRGQSLHRQERARPLPVITWTVNSPEKLERAKKFADNIIFEGIEPLVASDYIPSHKPRTL